MLDNSLPPCDGTDVYIKLFSPNTPRLPEANRSPTSFSRSLSVADVYRTWKFVRCVSLIAEDLVDIGKPASMLVSRKSPATRSSGPTQ